MYCVVSHQCEKQLFTPHNRYISTLELGLGLGSGLGLGLGLGLG